MLLNDYRKYLGFYKMKKIITLVQILLLLIIISTSIGQSSPLTTNNAGSLSGFITDENMNPLSEVEVTISCGENTFVCFSDESGYYERDDLPIVFCVWNISASKEGYETDYHEMSIGENSTHNFTLNSIPYFSLDVSILPGASFPSPLIRIKNTGNRDLHNIWITNTSISGNVLYNNRNILIANILEPEDITINQLNTWMVGFGTFSIQVKVTCDEGTFESDPANGLIIGPIVFIP